MKKSQVIGLAVAVVLVALVAGGVVILRAQQSTAKVAEMRQPASDLIKTADIYKEEPEFVDWLFEAAHPQAASQLGGSISGVSPEQYYTLLFQTMIDAAKSNGREEVGRSLRRFAVGKGYLDVKF